MTIDNDDCEQIIKQSVVFFEDVIVRVEYADTPSEFSFCTARCQGTYERFEEYIPLLTVDIDQSVSFLAGNHRFCGFDEGGVCTFMQLVEHRLVIQFRGVRVDDI